MHKFIGLCVMVILAADLACPAAGQSQTTIPPLTHSPANRDKLTEDPEVDRIVAREREQIKTFSHYRPIVETYLQEVEPGSQNETRLLSDRYFLGQTDFAAGAVYKSVLPPKKASKLRWLSPKFYWGDNQTYSPVGFIWPVYVDITSFDRQHYRFDYVGPDVLGEVRCVAFDVTPLPESGRWRFKGRIWAEDHDYTIVRFRGIFLPIAKPGWDNMHFDSWRMNVKPGLWLPAYVFSEENDLKNPLLYHASHFKSQTRFWGYDLANIRHEQDSSDLTPDGQVVQYLGTDRQHRSPVGAPQGRIAAEADVLNALQRTGLLAAPGEVDEILNTVVNNIEVANKLVIDPPIHCRVLTMGNLEVFSVGHTIVLSRGLIDVLPDESSIAAILAQELVRIEISNPIADEYGFGNSVQVSTLDVLERSSFRRDGSQFGKSSQRVLALLQKSPYKDSFWNAGWFMWQLNKESKSLRALTTPHLGDRVYLTSKLLTSTSGLGPPSPGYITARPVGTRVELDPWSDQVRLARANPMSSLSGNEKMPFRVTAFMPFLTRYGRQPVAESNGQDEAAMKEQLRAQKAQK